MSEECHVCLGEHSAEFHASAKRIRRWMIRRIADATAPPVIVPRTFFAERAPRLGLPTAEAAETRQAGWAGALRGGDDKDPVRAAANDPATIRRALSSRTRDAAAGVRRPARVALRPHAHPGVRARHHRGVAVVRAAAGGVIV